MIVSAVGRQAAPFRPRIANFYNYTAQSPPLLGMAMRLRQMWNDADNALYARICENIREYMQKCGYAHRFASMCICNFLDKGNYSKEKVQPLELFFYDFTQDWICKKDADFIAILIFPRAARLNSYKVSAESRQRNSFTITNSLIFIYLFKTGSCLLEIGTALPP